MASMVRWTSSVGLAALCCCGAAASAQLGSATITNSRYLTTANTGQLNLQRFTIEAWIKPTGGGYGNTSDGGGATIIGKPSQGFGGSYIASWTLQYIPTLNRVGASITHSFPSTGTGLISQTEVPLGVATHVALVFDGTTLRLYINGVLDASAVATEPGISHFDSDPILIGASNYCCGYLRRFEGQIDNVRVWDVARTDAEILAGTVCQFPSGAHPGLVARWDFDNQTSVDTSGFARDASFLEGGASYGDELADAPPQSLAIADVLTCPGGGATISVIARGAGPISYAWQRNGAPVDPVANPSALTSTLELADVSAATAGTYACVLTNPCGSSLSDDGEVRICPADVNCSNSVDSDDVIDYFGAWDLGDLSADANGDGGVDSDDVIEFFGRWDAGC